MEIIWKSIEGFEGKYMISNTGEVMSLPNKTRKGNRILKQNLRGVPRYPYVNLCMNGLVFKAKTSRLVAKAFIENPHNYPVVNHIDENPLNSCVSNLEWCTIQYNNEYSNAKHYSLIDPMGDLHQIFNLRKFARGLGIPHQYFFQLVSRKRCTVKGWKVPD